MKTRPFRRWMLLDYKPETYQALNTHGWGYVLTLRVETWWGLRTKIVEHKVVVPYSTDVEAFYGPKLNVWRTSR